MEWGLPNNNRETKRLGESPSTLSLVTEYLLGLKDNISNPNFNPKTDHP